MLFLSKHNVDIVKLSGDFILSTGFPMSSPHKHTSKYGKKQKNNLNEDEINDFSIKFGINYNGDFEQLVSNLAIEGQNLLKVGKYEDSLEISNFLYDLGSKMKDEFTKMKSYLLKSQLSSYINEENIPYLTKALTIAKKLKYNEIIVGVRIQLAYEQFHKQEFKKVLKEIKEIEKFKDLEFENSKIITELKSRCYWELDDYINGFESTYKWFNHLKKTDDMHSMFMVIVYLLTLMSSLDLPISKEEIEKIKREIGEVLSNLATSPHLFQELIPNIDGLFAKSLMMVQPEILYEFSDMFLQTVRWMDEEKYLYSCLKLADAFYNIQDVEKAIELVDKAKIFANEKKYTKIISKLLFKSAEFRSLIFYFMSFDPLYDPFSIEKVRIYNEEMREDLYLRVFYSPINSFASTSYSHFLRIIDKAKKNRVKQDSKLRLEGIPEEDERHYLVLRLLHADETINLLLREDFQIDEHYSQSLHSTVSPFYSVIGVLTNEKPKEITDVEEMEDFLLKIQRAINCPASLAELVFTERKPQLDLYNIYAVGSGFNDLKTKLIECAVNLKQDYPMMKNPDFLQIFQSDPITIFDFSLRDEHRLQPLSNLLERAYRIKLTEKKLSKMFKDILNLFLKRGDTRYWKGFFYQYAWLQQKGELLALKEQKPERKFQLVSDLLKFSEKLKDEDKILESHYYRLFTNLNSVSQGYENNLDEFTTLAIKFENEKYKIISQIMRVFYKESNLLQEEVLTKTFDLLCDLCSSGDLQKTLELFMHFISEVSDFSSLLEICEKKPIPDTGFLIYLHLAKKMIAKKDFEASFQILTWILELLNERKNNFEFPKHTWNFLFVNTNILLYDIFDEINKETLKTFRYPKEDIINNLLENHEWIVDPLFIVRTLLEKINLLLEKNDYVLAEKFYSWIEEMMFYYWDVFTSEDNKDLIDKVHEMKKKIVSQHFT